MRINQILVAVSCLSLTAVAVALPQNRHFPAPPTLSEEMAASVNAPAPDLWQSKVQTAEEVHQIAKNYAQSAGQAYLASAQALGLKVEESKLAGIPVFVLTPKTIAKEAQNKVIFYIHRIITEEALCFNRGRNPCNDVSR